MEQSSDTTTYNDMNTLNKDVNTPIKDVNTLNKDINTLNKDVNTLNKDMNTLNKDVNTLNKDVNTLNKDMNTLNKDMNTLNKDMNTPIKDVNTLNKDVNTLNKDMNTPIKDMDFPKTINKKKWMEYLDRDLTPYEDNILNDLKCEKDINKQLEELHNIVIDKGYYISDLTNLHGNCLFESLVHHNICNDETILRKSLAHLLYIYGNYKGFFESQNETLRELFVFANDIEFVFNPNDKTFYQYTYDIMCQDISNDNSWMRLPTQLLLMFISRLFNIEIIIIHDNGHETIINSNNSSETIINSNNKIYLCLMNEFHYLPLKKINKEKDDEKKDDGKDEEDEEIEILLYNDAYNKFIEWSKKMWFKKNNKLIN